MAGDQLVTPIGVTHISCHYKNTIEGTGEKRTNEQTLGVNSSSEREFCNTLCMCRLTLVRVTSENSTKQLECRHLDSIFFTGLSSADWPLCSCVDCPCPCPVANSQLRAPFSTLFSRPLPLPVTARIQVQNPLSGFAPKQTKESSAWRATYIVLRSKHS